MITPARALLFISPDDADHPNRAKVTILENGRALGPAHSQHSFIRERGDGAFSQWGERLYFSSSDNSDPRSNGRTYSVRSNFQPASGTYLLILALGAISILLNRNSLAEAAHWLRGNVPTRPPSRHGIRDKVLLALLAVVAVPLFIALDGEIWIRLKHPEMFNEVLYPGMWSSKAGFIFAPHSQLRFTNHLDYWTRQTINSHGFPDREWNPVKPQGTLRVEFLGDSYVEAAQVPIANKLQVRFEEEANRALAPKRIETAAFGHAGTGQSNQLQYYDSEGREFHPDVVVLVFNYADFAYNSALLECVEYGWHPDHLPRLFLVRKAPDSPFAPAPIDPDYQRYFSPGGPTQYAGGTWLSHLQDWLTAKSFFYSWLASATPLRFPRLGAPIQQKGPALDVTSERIAAIERIPGYEHSFDGWNYPRDWDASSMFAAKHLAPVFHDAVEATGAALDAFVARGRRDGFRLVIFTTELVSRNVSNPEIERETGNPGIERGYLVRIKQLADQRGIPVVEFAGFAEKHGIDPARTHWDHDLHWNPLGHKMAAEALLEAFEAHPEWLEPVTSRN